MRRGSIALLLLVAQGDAAGSPSPGDGPEPPSRYAGTRPAKKRAFTGGARQAVTGASGPGALTGKTIYLSAGHGWTYVNGGWHTQRGNTNDLVEDFITIEGVNQYLIPYLRNMGAYVVPIREADLSPTAAVVDDADAALEGDAAELESTDVGFAPFTPPIDATVLPFERGGARRMEAAADETGRAIYPVAVAETGTYNVYVSYVQGADRAPDAHYIVRHGGGASHLRVDQRRHGGTWVLLGRWWFEAGAAAERASIEVANDSESPGAVISLDAVRVGGGMGVHDVGGGVTGRPAFESSARYSTQLLGAPASVYRYFDGGEGDDVVARPRFAAWDHEAGEDAIYLAVHTNAPDPARGTTSIAYGPKYPCCGGLDEFTGTAGSLELMDAIHGEVLADLRAAWDPGWQDRGKVTASLGELRPDHNDEMPAVLIEVAFHDTPADADALRDPRFRRISSRAMAQGIARYFAERDGAEVVLPPEPPVAVTVANDGAGGLRVSWRAPADTPGGGDGATGYRVYVSDNGHGFDDGTPAGADGVVLDGLEPGDVRYVRVAATNDGGESMPTEVVGARVAAAGAAQVLVVAGFDRLDGDLLPSADLAAFGLGAVDRMLIDRINDGSYAARHGAALADAGFAFDGATDDAVELGDVDLAAYRAVDWFTGEDSTGDDPIAAPSRAAIEALLAAGGRLFLSGSEVVWTLASQGDADDVAFANDVLKVGLSSDDAGTYEIASGAGPLAALGAFAFDDDGPGGYDADYPDALTPQGDAAAALSYDGGEAAAVAWGRGGDAGGAIILGFPFEVVAGEAARAELMGAAMTAFGIEPEPEPTDEPDDDDPDDDQPGVAGACGCGAGGAGGGGLWLVAIGLALTRRRPGRARSRRSARAG